MKDYSAIKFYDQSEMKSLIENNVDNEKDHKKERNNNSNKLLFAVFTLLFSMVGYANHFNKNYLNELFEFEDTITAKDEFSTMVMQDLMKGL